MAKREFIEKEAAIKALNADFTISGKKNMETVVDYINGSYNKINSLPAFTAQDIVKPYLDKLKEQIEQNVERYCLSRESHGMGKVDWNEYLITESKVIELIDNLLSEQGDTE